MSTITFQCQSCNSDYEVKITHLLERPNALKCTQCDSRPPPRVCHAFAQALDDLLTAMAGMRSKVQFELSLDSDELPEPYGTADTVAGGLSASLADEDEDADEDVDDDDDEEDDDDDFEDDDDLDFDDDEEEEAEADDEERY